MHTVHSILYTYIRYLLDVKECIYADFIHFTNRKQTVNGNSFTTSLASYSIHHGFEFCACSLITNTSQLSLSQWCHCFSETFRFVFAFCFIREWAILLSPDSKIDVRRAWCSSCNSKPVDTNQTFKSFRIAFFSLAVSLSIFSFFLVRFDVFLFIRFHFACFEPVICLTLHIWFERVYSSFINLFINHFGQQQPNLCNNIV